MAMCNDCEQLVGKLKDIPPHANLKETSSKKFTGGMARGRIRFYECASCGTRWSCDGDTHDSFAGWTKESPR